MENHTLATIAEKTKSLELLIDWARRKGVYHQDAIKMTERKLRKAIENPKFRSQQDAQLEILHLLLEKQMPCFNGEHNSYLD